MLVLIPKDIPGEFRGIALLEILYKVISSIVTARLMAGIEFDDTVHGFRAGRGTGTAGMEFKLNMQLAQRTKKPLFIVFLDLKKAYDTLDRERTIEILRKYGVGENVRRLADPTNPGRRYQPSW